MLEQRAQFDRIPKLRAAARNCPYCMYCLRPNDGTVVLAHDNQVAHGKGVGKKTPDFLGAYLCSRCHDEADGRCGDLNKQSKHEIIQTAHARTLKWWFESGIVRC